MAKTSKPAATPVKAARMAQPPAPKPLYADTQETVDPKPRTERKEKARVPGQPTEKAVRQSVGPLKVQALSMCYYEHKRRRPGDVFTLSTIKHFNKKAMQWVDPSTPERITVGREALAREHDEILAMKHAGRAVPARPHADDDVI